MMPILHGDVTWNNWRFGVGVSWVRAHRVLIANTARWWRTLGALDETFFLGPFLLRVGLRWGGYLIPEEAAK